MLRVPRPSRVLLSMFVSLVVACGAARAEDTAPRLALVIGNANYRASPLPTALDDAGLVAQSLAQAGFEVTAGGDADAATIRKLFHDFQAKLQTAGPDAVAFVYLTGYGLQFGGENYVVPADGHIARDIDVPSEAVPLSELTKPLDTLSIHARILAFDLARVGPFVTSGSPLASGLGLPTTQSGTLTAFNAAPGTVAVPDTIPNGVYARSLAEMIQVPGLPMDALFQRVRLRVSQRTNGAVLPSESGAADFVFYPGRAVVAAPSAVGSGSGDAFAACVKVDLLSCYVDFARFYPTDPLAARVRRIIAVRREALIWREALQANTVRAYWTYMRRYPRGPHFGDVRRRLAALHDYLEPPPRFEIYPFRELPPSDGELTTFGRRETLLADPDWPAIPASPAGDLPPPRAAFFDALPPPPIAPPGIVPLPMPIDLPPEAAAATLRFGGVAQPYAAAGAIAGETTGPTVFLRRDGKLLSRTVASTDHDAQVLVQTGGNGGPISRTVTIRESNTVAIVQRGPSGDVLMQIVTRKAPDGGSSTAVIDAKSQLIADQRLNSAGIAVSRTRGTVPVRDQMFVLVPGTGSDAKARVLSVAQLETGDQAPAAVTAPVAGPIAGPGAAPTPTPAVTTAATMPTVSAPPPKPDGGAPTSAPTVAGPLPGPVSSPAPSLAGAPPAVSPVPVSPTATPRLPAPDKVSAVPTPQPELPKSAASPTGGAVLGTGPSGPPSTSAAAGSPKPGETPATDPGISALTRTFAAQPAPLLVPAPPVNPSRDTAATPPSDTKSLAPSVENSAEAPPPAEVSRVPSTDQTSRPPAVPIAPPSGTPVAAPDVGSTPSGAQTSTPGPLSSPSLGTGAPAAMSTQPSSAAPSTAPTSAPQPNPERLPQPAPLSKPIEPPAASTSQTQQPVAPTAAPPTAAPLRAAPPAVEPPPAELPTSEPPSGTPVPMPRPSADMTSPSGATSSATLMTPLPPRRPKLEAAPRHERDSGNHRKRAPQVRRGRRK